MDVFFSNSSNFNGRANILGAFRESINVFDASNHYKNSSVTQRIAILITENNPTITPDDDLFGPDPCQPEYDLNTTYSDLNIYLYGALISPAISSYYTCFEPDTTLIEVDDATDLETQMPNIVGQIPCPLAISCVNPFLFCFYITIITLYHWQNKIFQLKLRRQIRQKIQQKFQHNVC